MAIHKIAIIGAGAIGTYIYHGLLPKIQKQDISVFFLAEGTRKEKLETRGFQFQDIQIIPEVRTPQEAGHLDLVIVTVKYNALQDILNDMETITDEHTTVISLLNGIDSEEIIAQVVPSHQIVYSLVRVSVQRRENNITYNPASDFGVFFGMVSEDQRQRVQDLAELFEGTHLPYTVCDDILARQWHKYALNISANLPQALLGVGCGAYNDSKHVQWLRDHLAEEVLKTAESYGIHIDHVSYGNWKPEGRLSTLQDLDAKRPTEIEMFLGVLLKKAEAVQVKIPYCEYTYHAIKALEEKNAGLFDYEKQAG